MPLPITWMLWEADFSAITPLDATFTPTIATLSTVGIGPAFGRSFGPFGMASTTGASSGASNPYPIVEVIESGIVGVAYSVTVSGVNGTSPYTFSQTGGTLPIGLTLNGSTGVISGTPTTAGTYTFTIQVTDSTLLTNSYTFQIIIASPSGGGSFVFIG